MTPKFKKGDLVVKARPYSEDTYCRFGGGESCVPLGTQGEVKFVYSYGENRALVRFINNELWNVSPTELDLVSSTSTKVEPTVTLDSVILPQEQKDLILSTISQIKEDIQSLIFSTWGFGDVLSYGKGVGILLCGPPGTGKTQTALAIAGELGKDYLFLSNAQLQSPIPGQMERNIEKAFEEAGMKGLVVILDECDSILVSRNSVGHIMAGEINFFLSALEKFEGICILTTNRAPTLDEALERRLALKMEIAKPTREARAKIWRSLIPSKCPLIQVSLETLAEYELTGGQIKNAILTGARIAAARIQGKTKDSNEKIDISKEGILQSELETGVKAELLGRKAWETGRGYSPLREILDIAKEKENGGQKPGAV